MSKQRFTWEEANKYIERLEGALKEICEYKGRATFYLIDGTMDEDRNMMQASHDAYQDCVRIAEGALVHEKSSSNNQSEEGDD